MNRIESAGLPSNNNLSVGINGIFSTDVGKLPYTGPFSVNSFSLHTHVQNLENGFFGVSSAKKLGKIGHHIRDFSEQVYNSDGNYDPFKFFKNVAINGSGMIFDNENPYVSSNFVGKVSNNIAPYLCGLSDLSQAYGAITNENSKYVLPSHSAFTDFRLTGICGALSVARESLSAYGSLPSRYSIVAGEVVLKGLTGPLCSVTHHKSAYYATSKYVSPNHSAFIDFNLTTICGALTVARESVSAYGSLSSSYSIVAGEVVLKGLTGSLCSVAHQISAYNTENFANLMGTATALQQGVNLSHFSKGYEALNNISNLTKNFRLHSETNDVVWKNEPITPYERENEQIAQLKAEVSDLQQETKFLKLSLRKLRKEQAHIITKVEQKIQLTLPVSADRTFPDLEENTSEELIDMYGVMKMFSISESTYYRNKHIWPAYKIGSKNLYKASEIKAYIKRFSK